MGLALDVVVEANRALDVVLEADCLEDVVDGRPRAAVVDVDGARLDVVPASRR